MTVGEAMGLFTAEKICDLDDADVFVRSFCGAELNFSIGMSRLGHEVTYVTCLGDDPLGRAAKKFISDNNIDCRYVFFDKDHNTGLQMKAKTDRGDPDVANFRRHSAFCDMNGSVVDNIGIDGYEHLHITGIPLAVSENARGTVLRLAKKAKDKGLSISFDPNLRPALWHDNKTMIDVVNEAAGYADIVLPGIKEGEILTGSGDKDRIASFYLSRGVKKVVIKDGANGAYLYDKDGAEYFEPSFKVEKVVDTVGAGDGFAAGVISAMLENLPPREVLKRGNAIGALVIQYPGDNDGLPDREKLTAYIKKKTVV